MHSSHTRLRNSGNTNKQTGERALLQWMCSRITIKLWVFWTNALWPWLEAGSHEANGTGGMPVKMQQESLASLDSLLLKRAHWNRFLLGIWTVALLRLGGVRGAGHNIDRMELRTFSPWRAAPSWTRFPTFRSVSDIIWVGVRIGDFSNFSNDQ